MGEPGQVTRLFPQSILRGMGYPLDIQVILKVTDIQVTQLSCVLQAKQSNYSLRGLLHPNGKAVIGVRTTFCKGG